MGEVTKTIATYLVAAGAVNWGFTAIGSWASLDAGEPPYPRTTPFNSYLIGSYNGGDGVQAGVNVIFFLVGLASIFFLFMVTPLSKLWPAVKNDPSMVYKVIRLLTVVLVIAGGANWLATGLAAVFDPDTSERKYYIPDLFQGWLRLSACAGGLVYTIVGVATLVYILYNLPYLKDVFTLGGGRVFATRPPGALGARQLVFGKTISGKWN